VPQPEPVRIVIADDHPIFRRGLKSLLEAEPGFLVVGEVGTGDDAVKMSRALRPDVLLLDLAMPGSGLSGMDTLRELATASLSVRSILLTASIQKPEILQALQLGAAGVVLKSAPPELLLKSIRSVMAGQHWIGRDSVSDLVQALRSYGDTSPHPRVLFGLTARELEVTCAVVSGLSNKEIAKKFVLSENTIKHHLTNIFDKVGASNRLELALFAVHHRLLEERDAVGP
jgi:two-component system, NarL family, nitrate/nitrite response regulator NarL